MDWFTTLALISVWNVVAMGLLAYLLCRRQCRGCRAASLQREREVQQMLTRAGSK